METESLFESVASKLRRDPRVTETKMFGALGLQVGGKAFGMLYKGRLVVKLPRERVQALVASGTGAFFDPGHGRLMKEWVAVPPGAVTQWLRLADEAREFVAGQGAAAASLPAPKATRRPAKRR